MACILGKKTHHQWTRSRSFIHGSAHTQDQQVFIFSADESGIPWNEWLSKSRLKRTNPRLWSRNLGTCMNSCSKRLKGSALQSKWYLLCVSSVIQQTLKENTLVFRSSLQKAPSSGGSNRQNPSCCKSSYLKGEEPTEPTLWLRPTPTSWAITQKRWRRWSRVAPWKLREFFDRGDGKMGASKLK